MWRASRPRALVDRCQSCFTIRSARDATSRLRSASGAAGWGLRENERKQCLLFLTMGWCGGLQERAARWI